MSDKDIELFGLHPESKSSHVGYDMSDMPDQDGTGRKLSKKLVMIVLIVVVVVLTPIVMLTSTQDDAKQKEKAKEKQQKEREADIKIPTSLDSVNKVVKDQEAAGKKIAQQQQAKAASQTAVSGALGTTNQSNAFAGGTPLPTPLAQPGSPLPQGQMSPQQLQDEQRKDAERKRMVEIAGSQIVVLSKSNSGGEVGSGLSQIDGLVKAAKQNALTGSNIDQLTAQAEREAANAGQSPDQGAKQDPDKQWLKTVRNDSSSDASPITPTIAQSKFTVFQGTVIPAVLLTAVNSDLPGQIAAQVTQNIYDGVTGKTLVIPKGSRLVGEYNNGVKIGQARVMAAFTRLIYPSGASISLGGMEATDAGGTSGLEGDVNNHFWAMFGSSFLVAGLADLMQKDNPQSVTVVNTSGTTQSLASAAGQVLVDTSKTILDRNKNMTPTIVVPRGSRMTIFVQKDMILPPSITSVVPMR